MQVHVYIHGHVCMYLGVFCIVGIMNMYICMYTYTHIVSRCAWCRLYNACMYVWCACMRMDGRLVFVTMQVCKRICMDSQVHVSSVQGSCVCMYAHVCIIYYIHSYIHTHIHTYILAIYKFIHTILTIHTYVYTCIHTYIHT